MPSIQQHQKLVAAIAWKICDSLSTKVDTHSIVSTCLLHDLGNILKGSGNYSPVGEEGYWEDVMKETREKFGEDEEIATVNMIKSLKLENEEKILQYLSWIGGHKYIEKSEEELKQIEFVIAPYADSRVAPNGIVTIEERIEDARERYNFKNDKGEEILKAMKRMEITVFSRSWMTAIDVTYDKIQAYLKKVEDYDLN